MHIPAEHTMKGRTRPYAHARAMWSTTLKQPYTPAVAEFTAAFLFYLLCWLALRYHPNDAVLRYKISKS